MDLNTTPRGRFPRKKFISPATSSPYRSPLMCSLPERRVHPTFENISTVSKVSTSEDKKNVQKIKNHQMHPKFSSPITSSAFKSPLAHSHSIIERRVQSSFENISDELKVPTKALEDKDIQRKQIHLIHQKFVSPVAKSSAYQSPLVPCHSIPEKKLQFPPECLSEDEIEASVKELEEENKTLLAKIKILEKKEEEMKYIDKLHKYNEIKDVAQTVLGQLAVMEQKTIKEIYEDFGLTEND